MAAGIGRIECKRMRGKITVLGNGQTPRGQQFVRKATPLDVASMKDAKFKSEMESAVKAMLD